MLVYNRVGTSGEFIIYVPCFNNKKSKASISVPKIFPCNNKSNVAIIILSSNSTFSFYKMWVHAYFTKGISCNEATHFKVSINIYLVDQTRSTQLRNQFCSSCLFIKLVIKVSNISSDSFIK